MKQVQGSAQIGRLFSRSRETGRSIGKGCLLFMFCCLFLSATAQGQFFWDDVQPPVPGANPTSPVPSSSPGPKYVFDHRVFFPATNLGPGRELFWTKAVLGTYVFQELIKGYDDIIPGPISSNPATASNDVHFVEYCGRMFFTADRELNGTILPKVLHTMQPGGDVTTEYWPVTLNGNIFSDVEELTIHHNELWFTAVGFSPQHAATSRYPWRIHSPIPEADCITEMVNLVPPAPGQVPFITELESGGPMSLAVNWFGGAPITNQMEIWRSDGTPQDSSVVVPSVLGPRDLTYEPVLDFLYYVADGPNLHTYLARTDLTGAAMGNVTLMFADGGSFQPRDPVFLTAHNGYVYFQAYDSAHGKEVWRSRGTVSQTVLVSDIFPGSGSSNPFDFVGKGGFVYFLTATPLPQWEGLYRTEVGNPQQTRSMALMGEPDALTLLEGNQIFYFAGDIESEGQSLGNEVWISDGTEQGTRPCLDVNEGPPDGSPDFFIRYVNDVLFSATHQELGRELVVADYEICGGLGGGTSGGGGGPGPGLGGPI